MKERSVWLFFASCIVLAIVLGVLAAPAEACGTYCVNLPCGMGIWGWQKAIDNGDYIAYVSNPIRCSTNMYSNCHEFPCGVKPTSATVGHLYVSGEDVMDFTVTLKQAREIEKLFAKKQMQDIPKVLKVVQKKFGLVPQRMTVEVFNAKREERIAWDKAHPSSCSAL